MENCFVSTGRPVVYSDSQWSAFYANRVNNDRYMDVFKENYKRLIGLFMSRCKYDFENKGIKTVLREDGCGIGNFSKSIMDYNLSFIERVVFSDIDEQMLELCWRNTLHLPVPNKEFKRESILEKKSYDKNTIVVTHGVLEHFSDKEIAMIMENYKDKNVRASFHYVPLEGYVKPSFGDERLLSKKHWIDLVKPKAFWIDNKGCDLYMMV